jgi:hypothetical protein
MWPVRGKPVRWANRPVTSVLIIDDHCFVAHGESRARPNSAREALAGRSAGFSRDDSIRQVEHEK